jgi:ATP-dependent Clp protease ATP-binding subunit ClpX
MSNETDRSLHCSFCGKNAGEVKKLIAGPDVYICDECVDLCHGILTGHPAQRDGEIVVTDPEDVEAGIPTPRMIRDHLDQYVIGQEDAKTTIAVAVYNHFKRLETPIVDDVEIEKSNILMVGPTGSGKTLIAQSIARFLDVPLAIADATSLTEAGYVGDDVESIITRLLQSANNVIKDAERGIIFIDEIDKKRGRGGDGASGTRDVSGEGVQQALLKLLEGSDIMVPPNGKRSPGGEMIKISTKNILFIVGGAFVGLEKIIERSQTNKEGGAGIGFNSKTVARKKQNTGDLLRKLEPEHLVKFGMIPELIGRLPVYATLEELTEEQLVRVLTEPKNALVKQFAARFGLDDVELVFTKDALVDIAKTARERKTGARGLRSVIENALVRMQFELPELADRGVCKIIVGPGVVQGTAEAEFVYAGVVEETPEIRALEDKREKDE